MWRQVAYGVVAAVAAMVAMAALAAVAVQLIGASRYGEAGALTAAAVVLAMGGSIEVSSLGTAAVPVPIPVPVDGYGSLALRPLGVSLAGAVVFGAALVLPLRRRAFTMPELAVRAGAAVVGLVALAGFAGWLARGDLAVPVERDQGTEELVIGFAPGLVRVLVGALVWALVVLGACWLGSSRAPVPTLWRQWRDHVRPALTAAGAVAAAGLSVIVVGAALAAVWADDGPALLGTALLAAPNALIVLATVGLGARWTVGLDGPLGERLDARLTALGEEPTLSLGRLAAESGATWLAPVAVAVVLLLAWGAAAARTPVPGSLLPAATVRAGRLGAVLVVALPGLAALAAISLDAGVSVLGNDVSLVAAELHTSLPLATVLGLLGGTVAGFLGSLAVDILRRPVRGSYARTDD